MTSFGWRQGSALKHYAGMQQGTSLLTGPEDQNDLSPGHGGMIPRGRARNPFLDKPGPLP